MLSKVDNVLHQIEELDQEIQENGLPDEYKQKWGVQNNVGLWIISSETVDFLQNFIKQYKPKKILEIGTSVAYSTLQIAKIANEYNGQVISIEKSDFKFKEAEGNIEKSGLQNIELINGDAIEVIKNLPIKDFELIFIDGNKKGYLPQIKIIEKSIQENKFIIADNVIDMSEKLKDFLDYMKSTNFWKTEILEIGDGLLLAQKKTHH